MRDRSSSKYRLWRTACRCYELGVAMVFLLACATAWLPDRAPPATGHKFAKADAAQKTVALRTPPPAPYCTAAGKNHSNPLVIRK
jgi:hypothetical protein